MDVRIRKAVDLLDAAARSGGHVSFEEVASALNLSVSRFRHLFKANVGKPAGHYLRDVRLQTAQQLLETTFLSVKQVMNGVGVSDESHFARDFKRKFGRSPRKYRFDIWTSDR